MEQKASDFNHKRTKSDDTQPKLNVVWFVVRPCSPDTDFVVSSNYRLIGTPGKPFRCFLFGRVLVVCLHAVAFVAAVGALQLAGGGSVTGEERLPEGRFENLVALGADIGHVFEIVAADHNSVGDGHAGPDHKGPPDARKDP